MFYDCFHYYYTCSLRFNTLENTINVDQSALHAQKTHITLIHMNSTDTPSTERAKSRSEEVCDN